MTHSTCVWCWCCFACSLVPWKEVVTLDSRFQLWNLAKRRKKVAHSSAETGCLEWKHHEEDFWVWDFLSSVYRSMPCESWPTSPKSCCAPLCTFCKLWNLTRPSCQCLRKGRVFNQPQQPQKKTKRKRRRVKNETEGFSLWNIVELLQTVFS